MLYHTFLYVRMLPLPCMFMKMCANSVVNYLKLPPDGAPIRLKIETIYSIDIIA